MLQLENFTVINEFWYVYYGLLSECQKWFSVKQPELRDPASLIEA